MTIYLGAIVLLPVMFGVFCIIGAVSLSQEHSPLKIALFLLSVVQFFNAFLYGSIIVNDINPEFIELQTLLATTTNWIGWIFAVLIFYFLIYAFYTMIRRIAQQKEERLNY